MMTLMPAPAASTAYGLKLPMSAATVEGRPKTPLPMMEFTTSATRLQRPMARISWRWGGVESADSMRAFVSYAAMKLGVLPEAARFARALTLRLRSGQAPEASLRAGLQRGHRHMGHWFGRPDAAVANRPW